jgi:hypothetical protein
MNKNGNYWRMDKDTYARFMKHIHLYFRERGNISEEIYSKPVYAEIPVRDLATVCFLFGGYARDNETMVLTEYFPKEVILPWERSFTLNLYTEDNKSVPLVMDARE